MAIDITNAVIYADLTCNGVISAWNNDYTPTNGIDRPKGLLLDRESRTIEPQKLDNCGYIIGNDLDLGNIEYHEKDDDIEYHEKNDVFPLNYYLVNNPMAPGANGIVREYVDQRFFIASGMLSGCGFAVLTKKDGKLYIIHAGAGDATKDDVNTRREKINGDIFYMACKLAEPDGIDLDKGPLDRDLLLHYLYEKKFFGFLVLPGEQESMEFNNDIFIFSYHTFSEELPRIGMVRGYSADVICAVNEEGRIIFSRRKLLTTRRNPKPVVDDYQMQMEIYF